MRRGFRSPGYANVMSTLAVFIALGGTSYAVAVNSIGERQLKDGAVTSRKIRDSAIAPADLSAAARGARGPRGPLGPLGPAGPAGANGSGGTAGAAEAWKALPFVAGWASYATIDPTYEPAAFRMDQNGRVTLRGVVTKVTGLPANPEVMATLPPGYRPQHRLIFDTQSGVSNAGGRVDVDPGGSLTWKAGGQVENDFMSLEGLSFSTD